MIFMGEEGNGPTSEDLTSHEYYRDELMGFVVETQMLEDIKRDENAPDYAKYVPTWHIGVNPNGDEYHGSDRRGDSFGLYIGRDDPNTRDYAGKVHRFTTDGVIEGLHGQDLRDRVGAYITELKSQIELKSNPTG